MNVIKSGFINPTYKGIQIDLINFILNGIKTIESRPDNGSFKDVKPGYVIDFDSFSVFVTHVFKYDNLSLLLDNHLSQTMPRRTKKEALEIYKSMVGDKINKPYLAIRIEPFHQNIYYLHHGSNLKLDKLKLFKSDLDTKKVCFATLNKFVATTFIAKWDDNDFVFGTYNKKWYIVARYQGASNLLEVSGYLNKVEPFTFYHNNKLGLLVEYLSLKEVKVHSHEYIPNVRDYIDGFITIKDQDINWIASSQLIFKYNLTQKHLDQAKKEIHKSKQFNTNVFEYDLDFVIKENGKIIDGLDRAEAASFINQPYWYIEL